MCHAVTWPINVTARHEIFITHEEECFLFLYNSADTLLLFMCDEKKSKILCLCGRFNKLCVNWIIELVYVVALIKWAIFGKMWTQIDLLTQELRNLQATTQKEQESMRMEVHRLTDKLEQSTVTADLEKKEMAEEVWYHLDTVGQMHLNEIFSIHLFNFEGCSNTNEFECLQTLIRCPHLNHQCIFAFWWLNSWTVCWLPQACSSLQHFLNDLLIISSATLFPRSRYSPRR